MAVILNVNGVNYSYPQQDDPAPWGSPLSEWATAVTNGMLQKKGGNFTLTAEANFGASFGLLSAYFKSRAANPAASGLVRLAKTDVVSWRNNANNADLALSIGGDDGLLFNGSPIGGAGVTSVALSAPAIFSVGGSPVTSTGTLALSLVAQNANKFWAGPTSGGDATPTFRELALGDIPALPYLSSQLADTKILLGNGSDVASPVFLSGDITIDNSGLVTIGANVVSNSKLAQMATKTIKGNTSGSTANAADLTVAQAVALLTQPYVAKGSLGATPTFDFSSGRKQSGTLSANSTFTLSNGADGGSYVLRIKQAASGGPYTVAFSTTIIWPGGVAYEPSTLASAIDIISLDYDGTDWAGTFEQDFE